MQDNLLQSYRSLGVEPGAGWKEVRAAYREAVKSWHPDRFERDSERGKIAEERIKSVNKAYRQLRDYYRLHGELPLFSPPQRPPPDAGGFPRAGIDDSIAQPGPARKSSLAFAASFRTKLFIVGIFALAAAYLSRPYLMDAGPARTGGASESTSAPATEAAPTATAPTPGFFTYGSTVGEVYSAQGIPSRADAEVWHYGTSKVYFSQGRVVRWEESRDHPLHLRATLAPPPEPPLFFRVGSSKDEVRRVQGTPLHEGERVWDYGVSRVYFDNDRVVDWHESPLNPLKGRR